MMFRKSLTALVASAVLATATLTAPVANAQSAEELFRQSAEPVAEGSYDLFQSTLSSPITAPIGLGVYLSSMSLHFFVWCPIASLLGHPDSTTGRCAI